MCHVRLASVRVVSNMLSDSFSVLYSATILLDPVWNLYLYLSLAGCPIPCALPVGIFSLLLGFCIVLRGFSLVVLGLVMLFVGVGPFDSSNSVVLGIQRSDPSLLVLVMCIEDILIGSAAVAPWLVSRLSLGALVCML